MELINTIKNIDRRELINKIKNTDKKELIKKISIQNFWDSAYLVDAVLFIFYYWIITLISLANE